MTITPRTCANCAYFDATGEQGTTCLNLVYYVTRTPGQPEVIHAMGASDTCPDHETEAEDASDRRFIEEVREAGGMGAVLEAISSIDAMQKALRCAQGQPDTNKAITKKPWRQTDDTPAPDLRKPWRQTRDD